ncbi:MFS transporter [Fodinicola feengrottensis]|uniref:MFS transporter n=1 Tax=Fodinicola feengrottensis TaxID=435914 RepID=UPI002442E795|nr:MFS transporter [Fodinicola feengrottensis]
MPKVAPSGESAVGIVAGLRTAALNRPAIVFATTAMAGGIVAGFLPLAVSGGSGSLAATALLVQAATAAGSRWLAGRFGDRYGAGKLLVPAALVAAVGLIPLVVTDNPVAILAGMAVFGIGFGAAQNASIALMLSRVAPSSYGTVSALWNMSYDGGWGLGATGFGILAARVGFSPAFAATAVLMVATVTYFHRSIKK